MKFFSFVVSSLVVSSNALKVQQGIWGPADLEAVEAALKSILSVHMTPEMHRRAQVVATDVKKDIMAISTGRNLTKVQRKEKVAAAINELGQFQDEMQKETNELIKKEKTAEMKAKMGKLGKELDPQEYEKEKEALEAKLKEKKAELATDEKAIQLYKLKKELAEKQLELNNLEMEKARDAASKKNEVEDAKAQQEMIQNLLSVAKELKAPSKQHPKFDAALTDLRKRSDSVKASLAKLDDVQKKSEIDLDSALKKQLGDAGKTDAISKAQAMIKSLKKKEQRKFQKVRAVKNNQLSELNSAITSIEKRDADGLQKVVTKLQAESKATDAKSGHFLY